MAALWVNVQFLMTHSRRPVAIAMLLGRFLLLGGLLYLAARSGTASFLWATCGVLVARPLVLRIMKARIGPGVRIGEEDRCDDVAAFKPCPVSYRPGSGDTACGDDMGIMAVLTLGAPGFPAL